MLDASIVLATAAAVTERITIGYGVMLLALRAAAFGDGWISIALPPQEVAARLSALGELAAGLGRPVPRLTVVGPVLYADPGKAAAQLAAYAQAGTERVILIPSGDWQRDYERAAELLALQ